MCVLKEIIEYQRLFIAVIYKNLAIKSKGVHSKNISFNEFESQKLDVKFSKGVFLLFYSIIVHSGVSSLFEQYAKCDSP